MKATRVALVSLRTFVVVLLALVALAGIAAWSNELPLRDVVAERAREREAQRAREARERAAREEVARSEAARRAAAAAPVAAPEPELARFTACDGSGESSLESARLGDGVRDLLAISCGDRIGAVAFVGETPLEVVGLSPSAEVASAPLRRFSIVADDVTGDGQLDWLVGTLRAPDATSPATGALHLLRGDGRGGLGDAILLAPLAVSRIVTGLVDLDPALDFVVLHRPDPMSSRAPEAWFFGGGSVPVRTKKLTLARETSDVSLLDVDTDGQVDLVAVGSTALSARAGAGNFEFDRVLPTELPPSRDLVRVKGSTLGAGVLLGGARPSWFVGGTPVGVLRELGLPAEPVAFDGRDEGASFRVAWVADGRVRMFLVTNGVAAETRNLTLDVADGRFVDAAVGNFTGGPELEVALLVERSGTTRERDLLVLSVDGDGTELRLAARRPPIEHAPLHLRITLR